MTDEGRQILKMQNRLWEYAVLLKHSTNLILFFVQYICRARCFLICRAYQARRKILKVGCQKFGGSIQSSSVLTQTYLTRDYYLKGCSRPFEKWGAHLYWALFPCKNWGAKYFLPSSVQKNVGVEGSYPTCQATASLLGSIQSQSNYLQCVLFFKASQDSKIIDNNQISWVSY